MAVARGEGGAVKTVAMEHGHISSSAEYEWLRRHRMS